MSVVIILYRVVYYIVLMGPWGKISAKYAIPVSRNYKKCKYTVTLPTIIQHVKALTLLLGYFQGLVYYGLSSLCFFIAMIIAAVKAVYDHGLAAAAVSRVNWLRPRQNDCHFAGDIFKCILFNENVWTSITISLKFVPKGPINNIPSLV